MYGRRESGKTYFVTGMLFQQEKFIKDPFTKVIWINKSFQKDMYEKLMHANQFELEFNMIFKTFMKWENKLGIVLWWSRIFFSNQVVMSKSVHFRVEDI